MPPLKHSWTNMLQRLFRSRAGRRKAHGPPHSRAYAIGDVHGRLDLLVQLLADVEADHRARRPAKAYLIFLGDLVDRGPDSKGVLERLLDRPPGFARNIFLKGNHEEFFLGALDGDLAMLQNWLVYGGAECCASYGIGEGWLMNAAPPDVFTRLSTSVPASHRAFLEKMADSFRFGDYLFVHAGIRPGVPLENQSSRDLRWIREEFLEDRTDHGVTVVHGHTIVENVEEYPNRIAIDTGAYRSGVLTALCLEEGERWFIQSRAAE
jgi:serine/threonine protein phosphatase 1